MQSSRRFAAVGEYRMKFLDKSLFLRQVVAKPVGVRY
jgi:hypothetical protein